MYIKILGFFLLFPIVLFSQVNMDLIENQIAKKDYNNAEISIKHYLETNPKNVKAIELLGDVYGFQKKWDHAISQYKILTDVNPNNANYHYKYGGALGMKALSVSKFKAMGIIGDVRDAFLKATQLDPNHIDARWALVKLYMQVPGILGGSKDKALEFSNQLQKLSPVDGYLAKGYIYEYDKEPEIAENYYKKAVHVGGSLLCYNTLTNFYMAQNEPQKALSNLKEAYNKHKEDQLLQQIKTIENNL
jgi:tetratricopeptide (TPR) repeat protein